MIDKDTYKLPENHYCESEIGQTKNRVIIGNSFSKDMKHFNGWLLRDNGRFKRVASYTIDIDGNVYEHFPPDNYSKFIGIEEIDKAAITILLENEGWLVKDLINENKYIAHNGNIYSRDDEVLTKRWRKFKFWAPYSEKQMDSLVELVKGLCEAHDMELNVISHNLKTSDSEKFEGVMYRSNFNEKFTDVSPAWDYTSFKNKFEKTLEDGPKKKKN